tara:strand:+ start:285 stop:530 length:246 start_codon:yes stop_codon:yes gene_type:complete
MSKKRITSKRSKTRKGDGEYDVFRDGVKIGEIFRTISDIPGGTWGGSLTGRGEKLETEFSGRSVGGRRKYRILDWFREFFG